MTREWLPDALGGPEETTSRERHLVTTVPVAFVAVAGGYHPAYAVALVAGALVPELDAVDERFHRSWLLHTYLFPALAYRALVGADLAAAAPWLVVGVHFVAVGMTLHFVADYVYPKGMDHRGAVWPVRPVGISAPWGLVWLGVAWFVQWFAYLAPAYLPWLASHL